MQKQLIDILNSFSKMFIVKTNSLEHDASNFDVKLASYREVRNEGVTFQKMSLCDNESCQRHSKNFVRYDGNIFWNKLYETFDILND